MRHAWARTPPRTGSSHAAIFVFRPGTDGSGIVESGVFDHQDDFEERYDGLNLPQKLAYIFRWSTDTLSTFGLYEARIERSCCCAVHGLQRRQAARENHGPPPPPAELNSTK